MVLLHNFIRKSFIKSLPAEGSSVPSKVPWTFLPQTRNYPREPTDPYVTYNESDSKVGTRRYRRVKFPQKITDSRRKRKNNGDDFTGGFYDDGTFVASAFAVDRQNRYMAVGTEVRFYLFVR